MQRTIGNLTADQNIHSLLWLWIFFLSIFFKGGEQRLPATSVALVWVNSYHVYNRLLMVKIDALPPGKERVRYSQY